MMNILKSTGYALALSTALVFTGCAAEDSDSAGDEAADEQPQADAHSVSTPDVAETAGPAESAPYDGESDKGLRDERHCTFFLTTGGKACRYIGNTTKVGAQIRCAGIMAAAGGLFYKYEVHDGGCASQ